MLKSQDLRVIWGISASVLSGSAGRQLILEDTHSVYTGLLRMRTVKDEAYGDSYKLLPLYSGTPGLAVAHMSGGLLHRQGSFV